MADPVEEITGLLEQVPAPPAPVPPEPNLAFENEWPHRQYLEVHYTGVYAEQHTTSCKREEADLVSSRTVDGLQAPALDIDFPCRLVPSATKGHFHLYIDKTMTWRSYRKLLKAMMKAGVIERGYYKASKKVKASYLRTPEKPKGPKSKVINPYRGYW